MKISTRLRLTLFYTSVFTAILILSSTSVYVIVSRGLEKSLREELVNDGRLMAELFKEELKLNALKEFKEELEEFGFDLQILDDNNRLVVESEGWRQVGMPIEAPVLEAIKEAPVFQNALSHKRPYTFFSRRVQIPGQGVYSLHMAQSRRPINDFLMRLLRWMIVIKSFMILLAAGLGYVFASRTLRIEEESHARLKTFTADASHELRIPLTSLRGNLEVTLRKDRTPAEYKEAIEDALEEAENLSRLTTDLLWLTRNDAGQLRLNVQKLPLKNFLEDVFAQAQSLPNEKDIRMKLAAVPNVTAAFDPDRIRQLLLNLIENAFRYGRTGGETTLESHVSEGKLTLSVRDDGIGVPKSDLPKIFQRFYRVDKARAREQGGSGLGLAIVKSIAEAHGGEIIVESREGKGSTFGVVLPQPN